MCQLWIEAAAADDGDELLALVEDEEPGPAGRRSASPRSARAGPRCWCTPTTQRLRRLAVLDAVINNADRKGGHLLPAAGRPALRHRPRGDLQRRGQAAHPAVGLGRGAADGRGASRCSTGSARRWPPASRSAARLAELITAAEIDAAARPGRRRCCGPGRTRSRAGSGRPFPGRRSEPPYGSGCARSRTGGLRKTAYPAIRCPVRFVSGTSVRLGS